MLIDNDLLHRGIENRHSVYSSLYMSFFSFSPHFSSKIITTTISDRKFIFGIQNNNDKLYRGIDNQLCRIVLPYICYLFFLSMQSILLFFVTDCSATVQDRKLVFCMSIDNDLLHRKIENRHSVYSSLYMSFFLSLHIFCQRYLHIYIR